LNIIVNEKALEAAGVNKDAPVKLKLTDVTVEQVLRHLARQVGGDVRLGFGIEGNTITFSTEEELARYGVVRAYDVHDLVSKATTQPTPQGEQAALESLRKVLMENVTPEEWLANGGTIGNISTFGNTLVIKTSFMNHMDIERLLGELRGSRGDVASLKFNIADGPHFEKRPMTIAPAAASVPPAGRGVTSKPISAPATKPAAF
jgi:hypothetical protein